MNLQGRALDHMAGAYALGTLGSRAQRRFEALMVRDIAVRRALQKWELRLAALTPDIPPVRPADGTWQAIEKRIAQKSSPRTKSQIRWLLAAALIVGIAFAMVWRKVRL